MERCNDSNGLCSGKVDDVMCSLVTSGLVLVHITEVGGAEGRTRWVVPYGSVVRYTCCI